MLVPANAQLQMAHDDARAHNPPSAMAPGTLMLGPARHIYCNWKDHEQEHSQDRGASRPR